MTSNWQVRDALLRLQERESIPHTVPKRKPSSWKFILPNSKETSRKKITRKREKRHGKQCAFKSTSNKKSSEIDLILARGNSTFKIPKIQRNWSIIERVRGNALDHCLIITTVRTDKKLLHESQQTGDQGLTNK